MPLELSRIGSVPPDGQDPYVDYTGFAFSRKNPGKFASIVNGAPYNSSELYYGTKDDMQLVYTAAVGHKLQTPMYLSDNLIVLDAYPDPDFTNRYLVEIRNGVAKVHPHSHDIIYEHPWNGVAVSEDESTITWTPYLYGPESPKNRVYFATNGADATYVERGVNGSNAFFGPTVVAQDGSWAGYIYSKPAYETDLLLVYKNGTVVVCDAPAGTTPTATRGFYGGNSGIPYGYWIDSSETRRILLDGSLSNDAISAAGIQPRMISTDGSTCLGYLWNSGYSEEVYDMATATLQPIPEPAPGYYAALGYAEITGMSADGQMIWGNFENGEAPYRRDVFRWNRLTDELDVFPAISDFYPGYVAEDGSVSWNDWNSCPQMIRAVSVDPWPAAWDTVFEDSFIGDGTVAIEDHVGTGGVTYSCNVGKDGRTVLASDGMRLSVAASPWNADYIHCSLPLDGDCFVEFEYNSAVGDWYANAFFGLAEGVFDTYGSRSFGMELDASWTNIDIGGNNDNGLDRWGPYNEFGGELIGTHTARIEFFGDQVRLYLTGVLCHANTHRILDNERFFMFSINEGGGALSALRIGQPSNAPQVVPDFWRDFDSA